MSSCHLARRHPESPPPACKHTDTRDRARPAPPLAQGTCGRSPVQPFSLWRLVFVIWVHDDFFASEMDDGIQVQSGNIDLPREEDGAVACEQSFGSDELDTSLPTVTGVGGKRTFSTNGEVLHYTFSVLIYHLCQVVHGRDGVVTNTVQHDALTEQRRGFMDSTGQRVIHAEGFISDLQGEEAAAPHLSPPAETLLPKTPTRHRCSAEATVKTVTNVMTTRAGVCHRRAADLQAVPGCFVHVELIDCVLQAGVGAALRDRFGDGVDVELGDLGVVVGPTAGTCQVPHLLLILDKAAHKRSFRKKAELVK